MQGLEKHRRGRPTVAICQGVCGQDSSLGWGLELEGSFQHLNSMALILMVEFQTQE